MVDTVMAAFGQVDSLVNNAGVTRRADIMDLAEADWDRIHRVNVKGVFFCLQTAARVMIPRRSGRIVNIASIAGKGYACPSNAAYARQCVPARLSPSPVAGPKSPQNCAVLAGSS